VIQKGDKTFSLFLYLTATEVSDTLVANAKKLNKSLFLKEFDDLLFGINKFHRNFMNNLIFYNFKRP